jgi:uncharacterized protein Yka (UPF0111/DUF47 family)
MPTIGIYELNTIPIKLPQSSIKSKIKSLVEEIIFLKKNNHETETLEKEIDLIVYKLYEVTFNEVKIIDPAFWLSEEEFNKFKTE